jgi:hypothetical protein
VAQLTFNDKTAANGKTVTLAGVSLAGADAGSNLTELQQQLRILQKETFTVTATESIKIYDGNGQQPQLHLVITVFQEM